jgi:hypothetical protein
LTWAISGVIINQALNSQKIINLSTLLGASVFRKQPFQLGGAGLFLFYQFVAVSYQLSAFADHFQSTITQGHVDCNRNQ